MCETCYWEKFVTMANCITERGHTGITAGSWNFINGVRNFVNDRKHITDAQKRGVYGIYHFIRHKDKLHISKENAEEHIKLLKKENIPLPSYLRVLLPLRKAHPKLKGQENQNIFVDLLNEEFDT